MFFINNFILQSLLYQLMVNSSQMEYPAQAVSWAEVRTFSSPAEFGQAVSQTYGLKYCFSAKAWKSSQRRLSNDALSAMITYREQL